MSDTRTLLQKIQAFRQRLDALPRLVADPISILPVSNQSEELRIHEKVVAGSLTQAVLEQSIRTLGAAEVAQPVAPKQLTARARRMIADSSELIRSLRQLADDPLLAGPPPGQSNDETDPLAIWFRETAALMGPAVRQAEALPDAPSEQLRLCEGLEGILANVRQRLAVLKATLDNRRHDADLVDRLAHLLCTLDSNQPVDAARFVDLAAQIHAEGTTQPLRFLYSPPDVTQAFLGGTGFPAPARFVACHSLTSARIMARISWSALEWKDDPLQPIIAALLHDVGMLRVPVDVLTAKQELSDEQKRLIEPHPSHGAELVASLLPLFAPIVESIAAHHERLDGTGYPRGLKGDQISPLARLLAAVDVYTAMCCPRPQRPARDPRSALTDTLLFGEENILDRFAAEKLLTMSFYPIGSVVEMSDGSIGVVVANHPGREGLHLAGRPVLSLLIDGRGGVMPTPVAVNLAETDSRSVLRTLPREERARLLGRHYPQWAI
jgi:HD-GYP domain-containing protein (c-di-GMP phosphodiesterase class II)